MAGNEISNHPTPKKVLIVEDSEDQRLCLKFLIEAVGGHVTMASNYEEALGFLAGGGWSFILADLKMPGGGGLELIKAMPRVAQNIVAMTSHLDDKTREECLTAGFNECLEKPIMKETLKRLIHC